MRSIKTPWANLAIGASQPEFQTIHAEALETKGDCFIVWQLSDEERAQIAKHGQVCYVRKTQGQPFQPMQIFIHDERIEEIPENPKDN